MIKNHYLLTMKFCSIMQAFPEFPLRPRTWTLATEFVTSPSKNSWRPPVSSGHQRWLGNPQSKWRLRAGKFMRKSGNGGQSRKHGGLEGKSSKKKRVRIESTIDKAYNPGQVSEVFFIIEPRRCQINQFIQNWHQIVVNHHSAFQYTLWLFNIAMENGPFIECLPIKNGEFPWLC